MLRGDKRWLAAGLLIIAGAAVFVALRPSGKRDALTHAETIRELPRAAHASPSSGRFEFRLDPGAHPDLDTRNVRRPWRLAGEASIDETGRLQAATWIELRRWPTNDTTASIDRRRDGPRDRFTEKTSKPCEPPP